MRCGYNKAMIRFDMKQEPSKLCSNSVNVMIAPHTVIKQSFFSLRWRRSNELVYFIRRICVCVCNVYIYIYITHMYVCLCHFNIQIVFRRVSFRARCIRHLIPQKSARGKRNDPNVYSIKICNVFRETLSRAYWNGGICKRRRLFFLFLFVFRLRYLPGGGLVVEDRAIPANIVPIYSIFRICNTFQNITLRIRRYS